MIKNRGVENYTQPGWEPITQDNEEEVYRLIHDEGKVVFITSVVEYSDAPPEVYTGTHSNFSPSISTMAKYGGYYYHVVDLPPFTTDL